MDGLKRKWTGFAGNPMHKRLVVQEDVRRQNEKKRGTDTHTEREREALDTESEAKEIDKRRKSRSKGA
jgi:hypothetical protein